MLLDVPEIWEIDPYPLSGAKPKLIAKLDAPNITSLAGIAEIEPDIFAVVASGGEAGTLQTIWRVDSASLTPMVLRR